ncbi:carbonyl reductase [Rhizodiscina lignyota]|uniref:Carbonyl reductase n=1 Tax=Rhizodiscina lignyota TaxID=1504668 RepID=A0A9P4M3F2_9PEZI|nr:carbonyl reductase [Rhizodiscina lignyota]
MSYKRVAAVTGANKGVGLGIVRNLALSYPSSHLNDGPFLIYLTARDSSRGEEAIRTLLSDAHLKKAKALSQDGGLTDIKFHPLDISSSESIQAFAGFVKQQHPEGIDILINNAGVAMDGFNMDVVSTTLRCNYWGTLEMTERFLPMLKQGGRLVNVSSIAGVLKKYSESREKEFRAANSVPEMTRIMERFIKGVEAGTHEQDGFPSAAYAVSKAGLTGVTQIIGREEATKGRGVLVNACCPGWVNTDMTKGRGTKTIDQGAKTPVMLALGDIGGKSGLYWRDEKVQQW